MCRRGRGGLYRASLIRMTRDSFCRAREGEALSRIVATRKKQKDSLMSTQAPIARVSHLIRIELFGYRIALPHNW